MSKRIVSFHKGDRIRLNLLAKKNGLWPSNPGRLSAPYGIVASNPRGDLVQVRMEGRRSIQSFHCTFLVLARRNYQEALDRYAERLADIAIKQFVREKLSSAEQNRRVRKFSRRFRRKTRKPK